MKNKSLVNNLQFFILLINKFLILKLKTFNVILFSNLEHELLLNPLQNECRKESHPVLKIENKYKQ